MKHFTPPTPTTNLNIMEFQRLRDDAIAPLTRHGSNVDIGFNMVCIGPAGKEDRSVHGCDTTCCILGHAIRLMLGDNLDEVMENLGLSVEEASRLFGMAISTRHGRLFNDANSLWRYGTDKGPYDATPADALVVLDYIIMTGRVPTYDDVFA